MTFINTHYKTRGWLFLCLGGLAFQVSCGPVRERPKSQIRENDTTFTENEVRCLFNFKEVLLCADFQFSGMPGVRKNNKAVVQFSVDPQYKVEVFPWMKMPDGNDHGSTKVVKVEQVIAKKNETSIFGKFNASPLYFTMPGVWEIWIRLYDNGKLVDKAVHEYEIY